MWDQLPELILTQIFSHLGRNDLASVGQVCQSWNRALSSPSLWRSVTVHIDRDLHGEFPLASELATKYGQHMRNLELAWSRPYVLPFKTRLARNVQADAGVDFLAIVRNKDVQLKKLILTDWVFSSKWGNRGKLLYALANFLGSQKNLKNLSLLNANLGVSDVLRLLGAVARSCGDRLGSLDLRGAFREWQAPHSNPRSFGNSIGNIILSNCKLDEGEPLSKEGYLRLLGRLRALTTISLDYPALSDEALNALARAASGVLTNLHISVRASDSRQHAIDDSAWRNLVVACPRLTVCYSIVHISHYEDMCYLLLPSIPLASFQMFSSDSWDQSRSRNFRSTVGLLIDHYTNTLAEVMLQLRNNCELLDDLLISMVTRCKHLKKLQYDGILRSLDTVKDILQLRSESKTNFRTIHVKPRNVNALNRSILHEISCQYDKKMLEQGVDFRIEDPGSFFVFY